jgi:hypothetical protein
MCSYREKKPDPTEMMQLDGFTVDYCEQIPGEYRTQIVKIYTLKFTNARHYQTNNIHWE